MKVEIELEENPALRFTITSGQALWHLGGSEIIARVRNDTGCGTYVDVDGHRYRLAPELLIAAIAESLGLAPDARQQEFFVEQAKGFWWVTERGTGHNHAQTDSKERADQICRDLNAGVREFEDDGTPVGEGQASVLWSKEPPSEQGWYWYRSSKAYHPVPTFIEDCGNGVFVATKVYEKYWVKVDDAGVEWWPEQISKPTADARQQEMK